MLLESERERYGRSLEERIAAGEELKRQKEHDAKERALRLHRCRFCGSGASGLVNLTRICACSLDRVEFGLQNGPLAHSYCAIARMLGVGSAGLTHCLECQQEIDLRAIVGDLHDQLSGVWYNSGARAPGSYAPSEWPQGDAIARNTIVPTCRICIRDVHIDREMCYRCDCSAKIAYYHEECLHAWRHRHQENSLCPWCHAPYRACDERERVFRRRDTCWDRWARGAKRCAGTFVYGAAAVLAAFLFMLVFAYLIKGVYYLLHAQSIAANAVGYTFRVFGLSWLPVGPAPSVGDLATGGLGLLFTFLVGLIMRICCCSSSSSSSSSRDPKRRGLLEDGRRRLRRDRTCFDNRFCRFTGLFYCCNACCCCFRWYDDDDDDDEAGRGNDDTTEATTTIVRRRHSRQRRRRSRGAHRLDDIVLEMDAIMPPDLDAGVDRSASFSESTSTTVVETTRTVNLDDSSE